MQQSNSVAHKLSALLCAGVFPAALRGRARRRFGCGLRRERCWLGLAKSNLCHFGWTVESERNTYHPYPAAGVDLARTGCGTDLLRMSGPTAGE
jgi:hypothetical protein